MTGTASGRARVDRGAVSGTFSLDGETFDVENNIWVVGDDHECVVIDAPHSVDEIFKVIGDRYVKAIICTHAHDDHVRVAPQLRAVVNSGAGAPIMLHPDDRPLWNLTHTGPEVIDGWDIDLCDGDEIVVAGVRMNVLHTPGHAPGAVCLYVSDLGCVFTGDTLFNGGPGATGRSFSDRKTLENSIHEQLFSLPAATEVHTGHGESTTIGAEKARMDLGG
ncbi:MBL fold metallo-hydrolase [Mycolicibacterium boenickei]